jgi:tRNA nucleotidyltransferase (CCA-adding enzyme)
LGVVLVRHAELPAPRDVVWIAGRLNAAGYEAWAIGGAVRDALSGGQPEDWDLATSARPGEVRRIFPRTAPIGIEYGTVGVIVRDGQMYEVTTFRRDVETFGRRARVAFAESLEEDLGRRDFTINAVAWNPLTKEIRDPHGGVADLRAGILRTVGDPNLRFEEDRLRVLRALRFAGRFSLRIEERTWRAILASAVKLQALSAERIREELWKVLGGQRKASESLDLYAASGVLEALYPEISRCRRTAAAAGIDLWKSILTGMDTLGPARPLLRLALLLHRVGFEPGSAGCATPGEAQRSAGLARSLLRRLRSSNAEVDRVTHLIVQHADLPASGASDAELRRWIRRVGPEYLPDLLRLLIAIQRGNPDPQEADRLLALRSRAAAVLRTRPPLAIGDLEISGTDLRGLGISPGPAYGEILRDLLERVTDEPRLNRRDRLLELAREIAATRG